MNLIKNYSLSHKLNIPDALIAASAIVTQSKLLTLNIKDFKYIPDIELYVSSE
jgi:predicted nucleic acid-binding protein